MRLACKDSKCRTLPIVVTVLLSLVTLMFSISYYYYGDFELYQNYIVLPLYSRLGMNTSQLQIIKPNTSQLQVIKPLNKCYIVYLCQSKRTKELVNSLISLFNNFNYEFRYPVILFHEASFDKSAFMQTLPLNTSEISLLIFEEVQFRFPADFTARHGQDPLHPNFTAVFGDRYPGYHHMINFWFKHVFENARIKAAEYYWRFDTDSRLLAPVRYDVFKYMQENHFIYGYRVMLDEPSHVIVGLWDFISDYIEAHNLTTTSIKPPPKGQRSSATIPMYYNNFELLHIPSFINHPGVQAFTAAVYATHMIFMQRWGDAPLRWITLQLFFDAKSQVHEFCDIAYSHYGDFQPCRKQRSIARYRFSEQR